MTLALEEALERLEARARGLGRPEDYELLSWLLELRRLQFLPRRLAAAEEHRDETYKALMEFQRSVPISPDHNYHVTVTVSQFGIGWRAAGSMTMEAVASVHDMPGQVGGQALEAQMLFDKGEKLVRDAVIGFLEERERRKKGGL